MILGTCEVSITDNDELHITRADPTIRISEALVELIERGEARPECSVIDNVLEIRAANRRVRYELDRPDDDPQFMVARLEPPP